MKRTIIALSALFLLVTAVVLLGQQALTAKGVAVPVVLAGNALLFVLSLLVYRLYSGAMGQSRATGFVRQVYAGFMLKFFVLVAAAVSYFYFAETVNKPAVFICMGLYLVYNFLGTAQVVKKPADQAQAPSKKEA